MTTKRTSKTDWVTPPEVTPPGYTGEASKKGPVLVVRFKDGTMMQFPATCTYHFRKVNGYAMCIVKHDEQILAHIAQDELRAISGPEYIIRDGDAR